MRILWTRFSISKDPPLSRIISTRCVGAFSHPLCPNYWFDFNRIRESFGAVFSHRITLLLNTAPWMVYAFTR